MMPKILTAALLALSVFSEARGAVVTINGQNPGPTPFISLLSLTVSDAAALEQIDFKIYPKPASSTRAVYARYSKTYLQARGLLDPATGQITLPVFGLYANYSNRVVLLSTFVDQSFQRDTVGVLTPVWNDRANVYKNPTVVQPRIPNTSLSYDFVLLRNFATPTNPPIILDTDGEVRWVGRPGLASPSAIFFDQGIYVYSGSSLVRLEFDGTFSAVANYASQGVTGFHHNFDQGKTGILIEAQTTAQVASVIFEVNAAGAILKRWDFADIISAAMRAGGDDPSGFVRPRGAPADAWFHNNAATYRPSDDTLIASSRENFVIAVDYQTGALKWLLGDSTKKWYQEYPSLRRYALSLGPNTVAPIGQHALSIYRDRLLLFDNGLNSFNQIPRGASRNFSVARKYLIDAAGMTATEIWSYRANPSIQSDACSSVYEDASRNYLIDYARITALVGLDSSGSKVFDYRYPTLGFCGTIYNAAPIHLENMRFN